MPTDIGFTGQRGDSATGLDYYNARYYDPVVGLFISADTVLPGDGFDPWGLSRYAYVQGDPETMTDPTGHCDGWCMFADIGLTIAESTLPIVRLSSAIRVGGLYLSDAMDGKTPTPDDVAKARLRGDIDGGLFTVGSALGLACLECGVGSAGVLTLLGGYTAGTVVQTEASDAMDSFVNHFYRDHPVVEPVKGVNEVGGRLKMPLPLPPGLTHPLPPTKNLDTTKLLRSSWIIMNASIRAKRRQQAAAQAIKTHGGNWSADATQRAYASAVYQLAVQDAGNVWNSSISTPWHTRIY